MCYDDDDDTDVDGAVCAVVHGSDDDTDVDVAVCTVMMMMTQVLMLLCVLCRRKANAASCGA